MTHPTLEQLHDQAYGFEPESDHVAGCATCTKTVDLVRAEREFLRRALLEPSRRRSFPWLPLAAAALLVVALSWTLFAPQKRGAPIPPAQEKPKNPIDRLIAELDSPNELRREIARHALKAYGGAAIDALKKAKKDDLVEESMMPDPADRAIQKKLETMRVDIDLNETALSDALSFLRDISGLNMILDPAVDDGQFSVKLKGATLKEVLHEWSLAFYVKDGCVMITKRSPPPVAAFAPIRLPVSGTLRKEAAAKITELGNDSADARDGASALLRLMGFAAEEDLWKGLDSKDAEVRARCADLLRGVYTRRTELGGPAGRLKGIQVSLDMDNAPLSSVLDYIAEATGLTLALDPRLTEDPVVTLKVKDLSAQTALLLILQPKGLCVEAVGSLFVVSSEKERPIRTRFAPAPSLWAEPEEAAALEGLLARADAKALKQIGLAAVTPLRFAQTQVDPELARTYESIVLEILDENPEWYPDEPSGLRRQGKELPKKLDVDFRSALLSDVMAFAKIEAHPIPKALQGVTVTLRAKDITQGELLDFATRPFGLDYAEKDGRIVVDTAAEIRRLIKK